MKQIKADYEDTAGRLVGNENPELPCNKCGGGGHEVENDSTKKCTVCGGKGFVLPIETQSYPAR